MNNRPNLWQDWAVGYQGWQSLDCARFREGGAALFFVVGGIVTKVCGYFTKFETCDSLLNPWACRVPKLVSPYILPAILRIGGNQTENSP